MEPHIIGLCLLSAMAIPGLMLLIDQFWRRYADPQNSVATIAMGLFFLLLGCIPIPLLIPAVLSGRVSCLGRGCGDSEFTASQHSFGFWGNVFMLYGVSLFFLSGAIFLAHAAVKQWRERR